MRKFWRAHPAFIISFAESLTDSMQDGRLLLLSKVDSTELRFLISDIPDAQLAMVA